jgi:hypothetical protein
MVVSYDIIYNDVFICIYDRDKSKAEIADDDDVSVVARFSPHKSKSDKQLLIF